MVLASAFGWSIARLFSAHLSGAVLIIFRLQGFLPKTHNTLQGSPCGNSVDPCRIFGNPCGVACGNSLDPCGTLVDQLFPILSKTNSFQGLGKLAIHCVLLCFRALPDSFPKSQLFPTLSLATPGGHKSSHKDPTRSRQVSTKHSWGSSCGVIGSFDKSLWGVLWCFRFAS